MRRLLLTVALSVVIAAPAVAQQPLKLSFQDGRVSVDATAVPVRTILTEWGKVGGTKIVGAERITGAPMTVKLVNVTEAQALETILRSVAGYMAAPRNGATHRSVDVRPHPRDGDVVRARAGQCRAPVAGSNRTRSPARSVSFRRASSAEQAEQDEIDEPDENPPYRRCSRSRSRARTVASEQPAQFTNAPGSVAQPGMIVPRTPQTITINPAQTLPASRRCRSASRSPGMMVPAAARRRRQAMIRRRGGGN